MAERNTVWQLKHGSLATKTPDYWQAGKSVTGIHSVEPAGEIVKRFALATAAGATLKP